MKIFNTITAAELSVKEIPRTPFVVEEILPRGLTIFGGLGKVGKSWFSFWLAMQVAKGEPVWKFKTTKGTTLYLAFEDSEERLQERLFTLSDELEQAPANAHLCIEISKMGGELESRIRNFFSDHPDTNLIIIDTLQKVRGNTESNYITDYDDLTTLKNLADEFKIAIVLVHHLRKQKDSDIFNQITGSTGLQGAADTMIVLGQSKRGDDFATFHLVGRDVKSRELELERGEDNIWILVSDSLHELNLKDKNFVDAICTLMVDKSVWVTNPTELSTLASEHSGDFYSNKMITKTLRRLSKPLAALGIDCNIRKSNGYRIIELTKVSGESGDKNSP
ncbi:AAA family ATPase [Bengtsoniella intestinalis]|uniref:AAA family ATPase n=1 Tax=Bengtsoniella intestinalis TaxID=3073143 RepID=UPI00391EF205